MPLSARNEPSPSRRALLAGTFLAAATSAVSPLVASTQERSPAAPKLDMRRIPAIDQEVPSIGLGTWQQFDIDLGDQALREDRKAALKAFVDAGGTVVDSSPMYGRSEEVVGALSRELGVNEELFLATKVWTQGQAAGQRQMQQSLDRLGRRTLELMQVHNLVDAAAHLETMQEWKQQGTFRLIGVTHYTSASLGDLEKYATGDGVPKVDFIQLPYHVENRDAEQRLLPACKDNGVATMINIPFGSGGLFRRVGERPLPDHARAYAGSWAQAFLKFILANDAVTCVIPGTSDPKHAVDNCAAMTGRLPTAEEREKLVEEVTA